MKIKKAFIIYQRKLNSNEPFTMKEVLAEAGYSESVQKSSSNVVNTKAWQKLLNEYPDDLILDRVYKDALGFGREATDNRKLFLKMKGRLRENVSLEINNERAKLFEDEETES